MSLQPRPQTGQRPKPHIHVCKCKHKSRHNGSPASKNNKTYYAGPHIIIYRLYRTIIYSASDCLSSRPQTNMRHRAIFRSGQCNF